MKKKELQDNGFFYGTVLYTKDTITFQTKDFTKLMEEFQKSVEDYLEFWY